MAFVAPLAAAAGGFFKSISLGSALTAAAGATTAVTAISSGNYQSAVARNNTRIAEANAEAESLAAQQEAQRRDRANAAMVAQLTAEQGASGIDVSSRSSMQTRALATRIGAQEREDIARAGGSAAQRLKQDAANFRAEASRARTQGYINAVGAGLDTASSLVRKRPNRFGRGRTF